MSSELFLENLKAGRFEDINLEHSHEREILCGLITNEIIVTGSADHGLRVWNAQNNVYLRELFTKKYGHKEWVTSIDILKDGRIVSVGMDGIMCVWKKNLAQCETFSDHQSSISKVIVDQNDIAITSSYDCTIRIRSLSPSQLNVKNTCDILAGPHKTPILDFVWNNSLLVSGDKDGIIAFWDINSGKSFLSMKNHKGGVGMLKFFDLNDDRILCSGGLKDGFLTMYDLREGKSFFSQNIHKGSVNLLELSSDNVIVSGSSDSFVSTIDFRNIDSSQKLINAKQMITCGKVVSNLLLCGTGNGDFMCFDLKKMETLYGFGVFKTGGIRVLQLNQNLNKILLGGDQGSAVLLDLN